jgi:hypothetical protein
VSQADALEAYRSGRVTIREFAHALGLDIWSAHDLLRAECVAVSQGDHSETTALLAAVLANALPIDRER